MCGKAGSHYTSGATCAKENEIKKYKTKSVSGRSRAERLAVVVAIRQRLKRNRELRQKPVIYFSAPLLGKDVLKMLRVDFQGDFFWESS